MIRVALLTEPVTRTLNPPYHDLRVTVRRLRSPEWDAAREAAMVIVRDDAELLNLLVQHDLLPEGGVRGWKRMKDADPLAYARFITGVSMWLTAVECALVGVLSWVGLTTDDGKPAPLDRATLQVVLLDETISDQLMSILTEAGQILVVEGKPSGASPSGSLEPARTASAPTTARAATH